MFRQRQKRIPLEIERVMDRPPAAQPLLFVLFLSFAWAATVAEVASSSQQAKYEYFQDLKSDVASILEESAARVKMTKHPALSRGRVAQIRGAVGGADRSDVYFLGKTPIDYRLMLCAQVSPQDAAVTAELVVTEKDGERNTLLGKCGSSANLWVKEKGSVYLRVQSVGVPESVYYEIFVWYPGELINHVNDSDFEDILAGRVRSVNFTFKQVAD